MVAYSKIRYALNGYIFQVTGILAIGAFTFGYDRKCIRQAQTISSLVLHLRLLSKLVGRDDRTSILQYCIWRFAPSFAWWLKHQSFVGHSAVC